MGPFRARVQQDVSGEPNPGRPWSEERESGQRQHPADRRSQELHQASTIEQLMGPNALYRLPRRLYRLFGQGRGKGSVAIRKSLLQFQSRNEPIRHRRHKTLDGQSQLPGIKATEQFAQQHSPAISGKTSHRRGKNERPERKPQLKGVIQSQTRPAERGDHQKGSGQEFHDDVEPDISPKATQQ